MKFKRLIRPMTKPDKNKKKKSQEELALLKQKKKVYLQQGKVNSYQI